MRWRQECEPYNQAMPSPRVPRNLFRPGAGGEPPFLAGRGKILESLLFLAEDLQQGHSPARDVILYGPRGNGKTVLLTVFLRRVRRAVPMAQTLHITPDEIPDLPALCRALIRDRPGKALLRRIQAVRRVDISLSEGGLPGLGIEFDTTAEMRLLPNVLEDRLAEGPLILAVDEAHTLDGSVGRILLNAVQKQRVNGQPILLLLAGTPGLKAHLADMQATFWERNEETPVGLLSDTESAQALSEPLKDYGVTFAPDAIGHAVAASGSYPYFIQLWGEALTRNVHEGTRITLDETAQADHLVTSKQTAFYARRRDELRRQGLLDAACEVQALFAARSRRRADEDSVVCASGSEEAFSGLVRLGYVWEAAAAEYVPGIPSLMDYVASASSPSRD